MQLVDEVRESFSRLSCPVTWKRVTVPGLPVAWAGMHVPAVDAGGRPDGVVSNTDVLRLVAMG